MKNESTRWLIRGLWILALGAVAALAWLKYGVRDENHRPQHPLCHAAQAVLYRGAGFAAVWPQFIRLALIGSILFIFFLARFRRTLATMA